MCGDNNNISDLQCLRARDRELQMSKLIDEYGSLTRHDRSFSILSRQLIHSRLMLEYVRISSYNKVHLSPLGEELRQKWICRLIETSLQPQAI